MQMEAKSGAPPASPPGKNEDFGPLLVELTDTPRFAVFVLRWGGWAALLGGAVMAPASRISGLFHSRTAETVLSFAVLALIAGAVMLLSAWNFGKQYYRFHADGVVFRRNGSNAVERLRYRDIARLLWACTRFVGGNVVADSYSTMLKVEPLPDAGCGPIHYEVLGRDQRVDRVRDRIADVMSEGLMRDAQAGLPVNWMTDIRLLPNGLTYRPQGFLGSKDPEFISYSDIHDWTIERGALKLWRDGSVILGLNVSAWNFFPGFRVLLRLLNPSMMKVPSAEDMLEAKSEANGAMPRKEA